MSVFHKRVNLSIGKRAAGEGFSWIIGLVAILMIIIFALIAYNFGNLGKKPLIVVNSANEENFQSEFQRVGAYAVASDFNSSEKGKILFEEYDSFLSTPELSLVLSKEYTSWHADPINEEDFAKGFGLERKYSPNWVIFSLRAVKK